MRAVNLVPADRRRGGLRPARSGGAVYAVLAALVLLVVIVTAYVLTSNGVSQRKSDLARVTQEASAAQTELASKRAYSDFAALRQARVTTIEQLAASRFSWQSALAGLARVIPKNVWLTSVIGTAQPGVSLQQGPSGGGGGGGTSSLRAAEPVPAVELVGCTTNQAEVSRLMSQLRLVNGVTRVSLASSEKASSGTAGGGAAGGAPAAGSSKGGDCRHGSQHFPQFQMVIFFTAPVGSLAGAGGAPATAATPTAAPAATTPPPARK